jgi:hypothetical protein
VHKIFGIALAALAIAIAVVPAFTDCQSQGKSLTTSTGKTVPMKCHWTGIAEIGAAAPLLVVGVLMATNRRRDNIRNFGIIGIVLGAMAIAFPTKLIGVCQTPTMLCHTVMSPVLITLGSITIVGGAAAIIFRPKDQIQ